MIKFENVSKVFEGGITAVDDLTMEINEGETLVLLGTSGSGKTTTMKMVNRLYEPTGGTISIDGTDIMDQDPIMLRRKIGYAIQHIGLFPHMTIAENISVVPKLLKWEEKRIDEEVDKLLNLVGLDPNDFAERFPTQLSGGQQQRIGVARALAADPPIVLMDEPFGALDPITRETLQNEFIDLQAEINKTVIFVTHDVFEAVKMGDRVALMDEGKIQQLSEPRELVDNPANEFVDSFLGVHRFQLALITRTIRSVMNELNIESGGEDSSDEEDKLKARHSLIDAIDTFKRTNKVVLPVYQRGKYIGKLRKHDLLSVMAQVLGEAGEASQ